MRKLIPILLAVIGLAAGGGAGLVLRPHPEDASADETQPSPTTSPQEETLHDYVKLNNQFVVPVVEGGRVSALVILSLSLEVDPGASEQIYAREPKLRDAFLQVMFDHANAGGFRGTFTDGSNLVLLRSALREVAMKTMGTIISDVLIVDIVRQDN
jgi:flagellar protein FliL